MPCRRERPQRQAAKKKISYAEPPLELDGDDEATADAEDMSASGMSDAEVHGIVDDDDDDELDDEVHPRRQSFSLRDRTVCCSAVLLSSA